MSASIRKISISLPEDLVEFADAEAERLSVSRSRFIADALARLEVFEAEAQAVDGYRFFTADNSDFADASASAVAEALNHED